MTILVAAMGSTLRGDDGFGPALLERLVPVLPEGVEGADFGSHGVALVQRLYDGYNGLVLLDSCRRGGAPGTLYVLRPELPPPPAHGFVGAADVHLADPSRALALASALGVLPPELWLVGCEPTDLDLGTELSAAVRGRLDAAVAETLDVIRWIRKPRENVSS